jgi:L-asparaginase
MSDADRQRLREIVEAEDGQRIVITHGTDTMVDTARALAGIEGKTIVFTGAMQPARMRRTDSVFNVGFALAAVQLLPTGVYIAMNGQVFDPSTARKNVAEHRFEIVDD